MAAFKEKRVKQKEVPKSRYVGQTKDPNHYYTKHPAWNFNSCDTELWPFTEENIGVAIWNEILPHLKAFETRTWSDILITAKKQNHSINVSELNKTAQKRLTEKFIEQESIISLRLTGTHRIYGYIVESVFNVLWYDSDHGDNDSCVCRSHQKHT